MNKNSNTYQIVYSAIMVVIVGAVLALIYMVLKPQQDRNRDNDTIKQILAAINVTPEDDDAIAADYKTHIVKEYIVDDKGAVTDSSENVAFNVNMAKNIKATKRLLPVFVAHVKGETKYIFPVYGAGLWGPIWGYVALGEDLQTIRGAYFDHASETPGLGAKIKDDPSFRAEFEGKKIDFNSEEAFSVVKGGVPAGVENAVDAISGASITSQCLGTSLNNWILAYKPFLRSASAYTEPAEVEEVADSLSVSADSLAIAK